jgi:hypothetical protein
MTDKVVGFFGHVFHLHHWAGFISENPNYFIDQILLKPTVPANR